MVFVLNTMDNYLYMLRLQITELFTQNLTDFHTGLGSSPSVHALRLCVCDVTVAECLFMTYSVSCYTIFSGQGTEIALPSKWPILLKPDVDIITLQKMRAAPPSLR